VLSIVLTVLLLLPLAYLLSAPEPSPHAALTNRVKAYLQSTYAHDFKKAYRYIAAHDRKTKSEDAYIKEKQPVTGFALAVATKLAADIEIIPVSSRVDGNVTKLKFAAKYPDANALAPLLFNWELEKLNALPEAKQKEILATIDALRRGGQLKFEQGEEELALTKENGTWRVVLDWASGTRVIYDAIVPAGNQLDATPVTRETKVHPNEIFTIAYRVKNSSDRILATRIAHVVEPKELRAHLDLVECSLLLPVRLAPGVEREFTSTYMVRSNLPDGAKQLKVTYDFKIEN
jgi:hypothetical protein